MTIIVAPDHNGRAMGSMVFEKKNSYPIPVPESQTYRHYSMTYFDKRFRLNQIAGFNYNESYY